jgi:glycosyltransferase involved in cell wall biosynthesis
VQRLPAAVVPCAFDATPYLGLAGALERERNLEVLILARVHPMKGFDVLIPAMRQVVEAEPRARLIVAGPDEGGYLAEVRRRVAEVDLGRHVEFTGYLEPDARSRVLARAAVMVAPSHRENFCFSVAEGMAAGLPVVVSDRVNICDDVAEAGAGLVVERDERQLANALLRLLRAPDERRRMGASGQRLVRERYSPAAVGARLTRAYEAATGGRPV